MKAIHFLNQYFAAPLSERKHQFQMGAFPNQILLFHRHRHLLFQLFVVHWAGPGWFECFTQNKPYKQACTRTYASWACVAHGLQCLCVRGACCPSLAKQLVIWVVVEGTHRHRKMLLQLDVHWNVPGWYECSTENKPCKQVCARTPVS